MWKSPLILWDFFQQEYHQEIFEHSIRCRINMQFGLHTLIHDLLFYVLKKGIKFMTRVVISVVFSCFSNCFQYANINFCQKKLKIKTCYTQFPVTQQENYMNSILHWLTSLYYSNNHCLYYEKFLDTWPSKSGHTNTIRSGSLPNNPRAKSMDFQVSNLSCQISLYGGYWNTCFHSVLL